MPKIISKFKNKNLSVEIKKSINNREKIKFAWGIPIIFLLLIFLFFIIIILNLPEEKKNNVVIWFDLQKSGNLESYLEYDGQISEYLSQNGKINFQSNLISEIFFDESLYYLEKVHKQNPGAESYFNFYLPENYQKINGRINYDLIGENDSFKLNLSGKILDCSFDYNKHKITEGELFLITENFTDHFVNCLHSSIEKINGNVIFIGTDHALSLLTFKISRILNPNSHIALVVFDEHVDIYNIKDQNNIINKANVFGKLLLEGYADYIVFIGTSQTAKEIIRLSVNNNFTRTDIFDKIKVYSDLDLKGNKWKEILKGEISIMKDKGITNILISVDLDVLPNRYTGFEYSILAPAISGIRYGANRTDYTLAEIQEGFSSGLEPKEISEYIKFIKILSSKNNIHYGSRNGNVTIFGDVQELLLKQDINFKTMGATQKIIKEFFG